MSKYLVRYNVKGYNESWQNSTIYNVDGDMSEEDVINFEDKMTEENHGNVVTMISFDKLSDKTPVKEDKTPNVAVFFLFDEQYSESVLCYTNMTDVVSYTFVDKQFIIELRDDNTNNTKKYVCPIPGIWIGGKDVLNQVPEGIRNQFPHTYLFSYEYENYMTI